MQVRDIAYVLPFVVVTYLVIRRLLRPWGRVTGRTVETAIPVAMALIGCALLALRAVS